MFRKTIVLSFLFTIGCFGTLLSQVKQEVQATENQEELESYIGTLLANETKIHVGQGYTGDVKQFMLQFHVLKIDDSTKYTLYKISKDVLDRDIQNGTQYFEFDKSLVDKKVKVHGILSRNAIYSVRKVETIEK